MNTEHTAIKNHLRIPPVGNSFQDFIYAVREIQDAVKLIQVEQIRVQT
jgi:hypothetical protein